MNDLKNASKIFLPIIYADDTTLFSVLNSFGNDLNTNIDSEINKISTWLKTNTLSVNPTKTKAMIFHSPNKLINKPIVHLNDTEIEFVEKFNFLGVIIDKNLTFKPHINAVSKKVSKLTGILNRLKRFLPYRILITLYHSLILPHFMYGILIWGFKSNDLFKLQKKIIRIITKSKYNQHTEPLFKCCGILKIMHLCELHELKFCFKLENKMLPGYFYSGIFNRNSDIHEYNIRRNNDYQLPIIKHTFAKNNICYRIPKVMQDMPANIKSKLYSHSIHGFSSYIKKHFINSYSESCNLINCYICS